MYKIIFSKSAEKELLNLPEREIPRIIHRIETLSDDPFPRGAKKLAGKINLWRIRFGNYRIVYSITQKILTIDIIRIRHRKDTYR